MFLSRPARLLAGLIVLVVAVGMAAQFTASVALSGSAGGAVVAMLRYFTILANLLLAVVYGGAALGVKTLATPSRLAGATLAILLVGVIYGLLLRDLLVLSGGAKLADLLLHHATPILAPVFWLAYAPKGGLTRRHPLIWAVFPLVYFVYALARAAADGVYAYPFMNVAKIGWTQTGINAAAIAVGFILCGYVIVWLDGRLARRPD
jgi:hypothetical protein